MSRRLDRIGLLSTASLLILAVAGVSGVVSNHAAARPLDDTGSTATPAAAAALGAPLAAPGPLQERIIDVSVPLNEGDVYLGDITVRTTISGDLVAIDGQRFVALIGDRVNPGVQAELSRRVADSASQQVEPQLLAISGLQISFDQANLSLVVSVPLAIGRTRDLALAPRVIDRPTENSVLPANISAGLNLFASKAFIHERPAGSALNLPTSIGVDGFFNIGGLDGLYLLHQWSWQEGEGIARLPTTLIKDDRNKAIRFALGDVDPFALPLQGPAPLGGVQVSRAYNEIQPTRNVRPSGRTSFVLDRDSIVEVEVNGVVVRTLQLRQGTYNLRDLPFTEGLNNVRLLIQDSAGRREIANFSRSFTTSLLDQDLDEFNVAVGFPRRPTALGFEYGGDPQVTGFYRRGVLSNVTMGGNFQADRDTVVVGGEALWATRFGTFRAEGAVSRAGGRSGRALTLGWAKGLLAFGNQGEIEVVWDQRSQYFSVLNDTIFGEDLSSELIVRVRQALSWGLYGTASYDRLRRRFGDDETRWTAGLNKTFGRFSLGALYEGRKTQFAGTEHNVFLNLSIRLSSRQTATGRYDSRTDRYRLDYERSINNRLGEFGVRAGYTEADGERSIEGQIDYLSNRAELGVRFDQFDDTIARDRTRQTTVRVATGIGFADGVMAIGRPFEEGFAIVRKHPTLENRQVRINAGTADQPLAQTGTYGPALVSIPRAYQPNYLAYEVADLPPGYDVGSGTFELFPGAYSGFNLRVGSDAANSLLGRLLNPDGTPISLLVGELRSLTSPNDPPVQLFTNRTGRFSATGLKPGRYALFVGADEPTGIEIDVPKDSAGLVNVGEVRAKQEIKP